MSSKQTELLTILGVKYPIIQAGMVWCSGWELASAVSNAGGLGTIGAGSMYPEVLDLHIQKCKAATNASFAVNIPLLYPQIDDHIKTIIKHNVPIVISSAGSPKKYTERLQKEGIKVIHVVSSALFAKKSEDAGVDAVVAEGFEAGGHNGREETTTFCLIPSVKKQVTIPVIAAGGIYSGRSFLAAQVLGADGVQIGSRFVTSTEASAHSKFKESVINANEGDTKLRLKQLAPVRLLHNEFAEKVKEAESNGASKQEMQILLGKGRAKKGMFLGELEDGELEIGQCSAMIEKIKPAAEILKEIIHEYNSVKNSFR